MTGNVVIIIAFPLFIFKPSLSGNPFFQPPCALALLLCAWRLFRVLGCGGVGEVDYMVGFRCGAVASALLRQSRDTAEALSEMFLVAPYALSEGREHSLGLLQYSQHCHRSLIRARCGWLLLRLWPPFVGWMFFCSLLFRILSRTRVYKVYTLRMFLVINQLKYKV